MLSTYGNALLAAGHPEQAGALGDKLLAINRDDGLALALQATAWRMLGDPRYRARYDYGQFVRPGMIDTPDGWPNLSAYLDDLAQGLLKLHASRAHPIAQSLRNGTQADLALQHAADPAIRAFAQAIDGPIRRYMQAVGTGEDPLRRRNTGRYKLKGIWSVRLRPHGYHFNHFHPDGWLSSACYIRIPNALGKHGGEGWLQFGEPAFPTTPPTPPEYFVRPEPGLLVLFPSWFWHGTIPFSGGPEDHRLTIAFDVVPD
ncbi:MAG TPA: putative 2OG-Fe(II) oxygenase [Rhodanobacteraceae bacterium]|nr:putative 2OG-Fe(II) oxygenase [Rhodanobacteraceae bacterium]